MWNTILPNFLTRFCYLLTAGFLLFGGLAGCGSEERDEGIREQLTVSHDSLQVTGAWVRPGTEGGSSAGYAVIENGTESPDTLIGLYTEAASLAEVHESYTDEGGDTGMRPARTLVVPPGGVLQMRPGGLHIMFTELNGTWSEEDTVRVEMQFASGETRRVAFPVRLSGR